MARHYKRRIKDLDPERGDEFLIMHTEFDYMRKLLTIEQSHVVLCAYYDWLVGGDEKETEAKIADETARKFFAVVVAARKTRVKEYIESCNKRVVKKIKRAHKKKRGNMGQHKLPHVIHNTEFLEEESLRDISSSKNAVDRRVAGACAESAPASADNLERHDVPQEEKNETSYAILDALGLLGEED